MPSDLTNAMVRLKFLNSNLNWILNPNGWGNNIFIFYYSKRIGAGADSDRFHRFPCIGQVSKPKKE